MRTEIIVDCRELEAPEPLNLVVSKLPLLNRTNRLKMLHRLKPQMLLNILNENSFKYEIDESSEMFQIFIWKE
ncbi:MAG: hypothetical protein RBT59_00195 [Arcobacteraceae bacterium]|jgi:hypothetical protein|nr:hypothetical protein [Arcobacteraceae bacterium]